MIEKKKLRKDKRAVSPVIAEILMVAIVVILAAVIGVFVLGIGAHEERAPQASLYIVSADNSDAKVVIKHQGGDGVVFGGTLCVWSPDVSTPGTTENGGTLVMDAGSAELGSTTVFEPGEVANLQNAVKLTPGNTAKLVIIHVPSGRLISIGTITVVA